MSPTKSASNPTSLTHVGHGNLGDIYEEIHKRQTVPLLGKQAAVKTCLSVRHNSTAIVLNKVKKNLAACSLLLTFLIIYTRCLTWRSILLVRTLIEAFVEAV